MANNDSSQLPWRSGEDIARVPISDAIAAVEGYLREFGQSAADPARSVIGTAHGQLLLMPAEAGSFLGVKIASITPGNPALGRPRIQATYILMDSETLTPLAAMDGTALTLLRTPAVSAVAAKYLAKEKASRLVLFGTGPQAFAHLEAMRAVRPITDVAVIATTQLKAEGLATRIASLGLASRAISRTAVVEVDDAVSHADLIVCVTTSTTPLFDGRQVSEQACVIAVGSHEPTVREVDGALVGRSFVVVEDAATAVRECGDIVMAIAEGALTAADLISLSALVNGGAPVAGTGSTGPKFFKSSGMAWEDLAVAVEVFERGARRQDTPDSAFRD